MNRKILACVAALAMLLSGLSAMADQNLTVFGTGVVYVDADRATISVGVREIARDVADVQSAVNERIDAVIRALTEMGIAPEDIYTNSISIYPEYDYTSQEERISGYSAYNSISATTADIANVGAYIDAAFDAGANMLDNVNFYAADTTDAGNQALALAVQNAVSKAHVLADAAGVTLGAIDEIKESDSYRYDMPVMYAEESAADKGFGTQVLASQLRITATVTVQFDISGDD